jgi:hypothetical protein
MNQVFKNLLIALSIGFLLVSCEEVINVDLDPGKSELAVDALLNFEDGPQTVRLTMTGGYFDQSKAQPATGAVVRISSNLGQNYVFSEDPANPGNYRIDSLNGKPGELFTLRIDYKGESFEAKSARVRGTAIDTLYAELRESQFGQKAGWYANLVVRDSVGAGDFYWIRTTLNGQKSRRTQNLGQSLGADAAFDIGSADGLEFIYPLRNSINLNEPYLQGDLLEVEVLSIDYENWRFLKEMDTQLNNVGLFAEPIANVRGNIKNVNANSETKAQGTFGMARVSRGSVIFP